MRSCIVLLPAALILGVGALVAGSVEDPPPLLDVWQLDARDGCFDTSTGITADGSGQLYVVDMGNDRIQQFDLDGEFLSKWGKYGPGPSEFDHPRKVAVAPDGSLYVVEIYNHRIQRFDAEHNFIDEWGTIGSAPGQFGYPHSVAVDDAGDVYVTDPRNHRVQKFTRDGDFLAHWPVVYYPHSVSVGGDGFVYVTDGSDHSVNKFTPSGSPVISWGGGGSDPGEFSAPRGIHAGADGLIYVADSGNQRIQVFNPDGSFVRAVPTRGEDPAELFVPEDVTVDSLGRIHVSSDNVLLRFTGAGEFDLQWGCREVPPRPSGIALAPDGRVLVSDYDNRQVIEFSPDGERLSQFGGELLSGPYDLAAAPDGTVYVPDYGDHGVWKFPTEGDPELIVDKLGDPRGVSCDGTGHAYVADRHRGLRRIDPEGVVSDEWFRCEGTPCAPDAGYDVAVGPDGKQYAAVSTGQREIWKFDAQGQRLLSWGSYGTGEGQFRSPYGVAVSPDGNVWVTDFSLHRVQKFDPDGTFLTMWGEYGNEPGEFRSPWGIAADPTGKIYVADYNNHRIKIFGSPITHDYFSTDTTQSIRPCGDGLMTLFHGAVYGNEPGECEVETLASFLPFSIGLDALHVRDATTLLFSVDAVGHVVNDGGLMTLFPNVVYLHDTETGLIVEELNFPAEGVDIDDVNALYDSGSGRYTFTVDRNTRIRFDGDRMTLRPCRTYVFDPSAGTLDKVFNGCKIGLTNIDAFHIVSGDRFAFSTATHTYLRLDGKLIHLYPQNGYVYDVSTDELVKVFDGADIGLDDLDALFLAPGAR